MLNYYYSLYGYRSIIQMFERRWVTYNFIFERKEKEYQVNQIVHFLPEDTFNIRYNYDILSLLD